MLDIICAHIHNYFECDRRRGRFEIAGGRLALPGAAEGEYFLIRGSRFNDGVHRHPAGDLTDESFDGTVSRMRPPRAFLALAEEIAAWREKYGAAAEGPYRSENVIGVYAYTRDAGGWQRVFAARLDEWRRIA